MEFIRRNVNGTTSTSGSSSTQTITTTVSLTAHTIFGQPFDGTNDVKGDLSDASKITATGDISTDGKFIIKETDEETATYTGKNLQISKDDSVTKFEGGETYNFDAEVTATKFSGDVESDSGYIKSLGADSLASSYAYLVELIAEKGTISSLESTKILASDISVDTLTVTKAAHFFSLIIDEIKSVGGQVIISPASATLDIVKKTDSGNFKCYFQSKIGEERIGNQFAANDQVVCQTFNVAEGTSYDVSNTFYWRLLTSRGKETVDGMEYHYILLSGSDCAEGSGEPKVGDRVVTLGNRKAKDRQNAIVLSAYNSDFLDSGLKAPSLVQYSGINDYTLTTHRQNVISNGLNQFIGDFTISTGEPITDLIDANKYNRLILDQATAIVNAEDKITAKISGSVIPLSGKGYTVQITSDAKDGWSVTSPEDNTFSFHQEHTGYASLGTTYYTVSLIQDGVTIEKVNVPVIFQTGAVLSVMDDKISSAVTGLEGEISKVEETANSLTTTVQNMKVGGRNLLDDSAFTSYSSGTYWKKCEGSLTTGYKGQKSVHYICTPSTVNNDGYFDLAQQPITLKLEPDTQYTLSFYAKGANGTSTDKTTGASFKYKGRVTTYVYPDVGVELADNEHTFYTTSKWQRYAYTFKTLSTVSPSNTYYVLFRLISDTTNDVTYYSNTYVCMPKLEEGTMPTAWDSSEEDVKSYITQKAESIEAKIVSEDTVKSLISQSGDEVKAEVYDEMNKATGIDITNGTITLNADKTIINGNLNIRNTNEGLVIYDSDGNAKVMVENKKIPTIDNLDTSQSQMQFTSSFTTGDSYESQAIAVGTYKVGDTFTIAPSYLIVSYNSKFVKNVLYQYHYCLKNKTTGDVITSSTYEGSTSGNMENVLEDYSYTITSAGVYEVSVIIAFLETSLTYNLGWLVGIEKAVTDYTLMGTDGLVSVKGENQYLYYGDDGFVVRGSDYSGLKIDSTIQTVISNNEGSGLWGNLNSRLSTLVFNGVTLPTITVKAGTSTIGTKSVIRVDTTYYNADVIVLKSLTDEVWIKLPPPYIVEGKSYTASYGKSLKIKNLTGYDCYVYCENEVIYTPDNTNSAYYYSIGNQAAEFIWDGSEWIWFRNN